MSLVRLHKLPATAFNSSNDTILEHNNGCARKKETLNNLENYKNTLNGLQDYDY